MGYGGESYNKKLVRAAFWGSILSEVGNERFRKLRFLVLSGPDGGDARVLRAFGVSPQNVVICDVDQDALLKAEEQLTSLAGGRREADSSFEFVVGDVLVACKRFKRQFDVLFLDFCSPLSTRLCDYFIRCIAMGARQEAWVGLGVMYGRESVKTSEVVHRAKNLAHKQLLSLVGATLLPGQPPFSEEEIPAFLKRHAGIAFGRWLTASHLLMTRALNYNLGLYYVDFFWYRSTRISPQGTSVGTPMLYWLGKSWRPTRVLRSEILLRQMDDRVAARLRKSHRFGCGGGNCTSEEAFRQKVVPFAREWGATVTGEVFNIDVAKVAAWLAVDTKRMREISEASEHHIRGLLDNDEENDFNFDGIFDE